MTDKIKEKADLKLNGDLYNFNVHEGTIGPDVLDISKLYAQSGKFTYDPGFTSTANCKSTITYIDGEEGTLLYRGYPIDQLAEQGNYLETCYLLLNGELPNQDEYNKFEDKMPIPQREENPYAKAFWKWWPDLYQDLHTFRITGGEPLLAQDTWKVLDYVLEQKEPNKKLNLSILFWAVTKQNPLKKKTYLAK